MPRVMRIEIISRREARALVYAYLFREMQPDNWQHIIPSDVSDREFDMFEEVCREVMMQMEKRAEA
jgi:hypothetical protein